MDNPIETAIKLLSSAHVATDLIWERSDCVEALKKLTKSSQLDNELDRIVEWAEDLCGVGHKAWGTINPRLVASAILEAANNLQPAQQRKPLTDADYVNACMSYRHDFGLMTQEQRDKLLFTAKEWARAYGMNEAAHGIKENT
jgi:hypothetical protein